jgi:hypothetical protein
MVEYMIQLLAAGLRSAATLDPSLDTAVAVQSLLDSGADKYSAAHSDRKRSPQ